MIALTSRVSYGGPDRLDVTRASGTEGLFLAPSVELLAPVLRARKELERASERLDALHEQPLLRAVNGLASAKDAFARARDAFDAAWEQYRVGFTAEMRVSYRQNAEQWRALLERPRVVLCCFCVDAERCHRTLLARSILPTLGATFGGEL